MNIDKIKLDGWNELFSLFGKKRYYKDDLCAEYNNNKKLIVFPAYFDGYDCTYIRAGHIKRFIRTLEDKKFDDLLMHIESKVLIDFVILNIEKLIEKGIFSELLYFAYPYARYNINEEELYSLFSRFSEDNKDFEQETVTGNILTVYRGMSEEEREDQEYRFSWSLSEDVAKSFADRCNGTVVKAQIHKKI